MNKSIMKTKRLEIVLGGAIVNGVIHEGRVILEIKTTELPEELGAVLHKFLSPEIVKLAEAHLSELSLLNVIMSAIR